MYSFILMVVILNASLLSCDPCNSFKTCGRCIGDPLKCVWCYAVWKKSNRYLDFVLSPTNIEKFLKEAPDSQYVATKDDYEWPRCRSGSKINENWCQGSTYDPKTEPASVVENFPFASVSKNDKRKEKSEKTVQFKPQNISITARAGDPVTFVMSYKPAKDYPLDIYYLIDGSYTMTTHKNTLVKQANEIYRTLKEITNNVRFGVGSFVEKRALPYANLNLRAYSFKNHLSLTENIDEFVEVVKAINMTGNFDVPEAGLDALMQVMMCNEMDWKLDEARRIIILSTDSTYHSAGDGKMAGAYRPNSMTCHLKENEHDPEYALIEDYPSVSQINKIATEKKIKIMFASIKNDEQSSVNATKEVYDALAKKITGAESVELSKDLVNTIEKGYLALVQDLKISTSLPLFMDLKLDPPCDTGAVCKVEHEKSVDMNATLNVKYCPSDKEIVRDLKIGPSNLHERLTVKVKAYCQCECEKDGQGEANSPRCNSDGTYQCGVCKCNDNRYGEKCQCTGTSTEELDLEKCKMNKNSTILCSGRGKCRCGICKCDTDEIYGPFCQFGKYDCKLFDQKLCGGNGICQNNTCICNNGWKGEACGCTTDNSTCFGANSQVCSGKGECECGQCKCTALDSHNQIYMGPFCNFCYDCQEERCAELRPYVACYHSNQNYNSTNICDEKFKHTSYYNVRMLNKNASDWQRPNSFKCEKTLEDGSTIIFKYADENNSTLILIRREKVIPPKANIWIPVGSAIGAILLIGLLTVVAWKILVDLHDAREYSKFVEESANAGFDVCFNDTYQPPTTHFTNIAYNNRIS